MNIRASKPGFNRKRVLYRTGEFSGYSKKLIVFGVSGRIYGRWTAEGILII
jgi:hypothetical protein